MLAMLLGAFDKMVNLAFTAFKKVLMIVILAAFVASVLTALFIFIGYSLFT